MTKKILLLGATGRTGQAVLEKALARGWQVNALVRNPDSLATVHPGLTVFKGTPLNGADVAKAIEGCDAVISTLNNNRASDNPFAKPVSPPTFMADSIRNTLTAMEANSIKRIVVLSAAGVGDSFMEQPWLFRLLIKKTNLGHTYRDHDAVDAMLRASGTDWTLPRPVMLGKTPGKAPIIVSYDKVPKPHFQITRDSVAQFIVDSVDNASLIRKAPTLSQK